MYEALKKYIVKSVNEDNGMNFTFYPVSNEMITKAERKIGKQFPDDLKEFYSEIGYGFFSDENGECLNRLLDPLSIADFITSSGDYKYVDKTLYKNDEIPILETGENDYFVLKTEGIEKGRVYLYGNIISESFEEFISMISKKPDFYVL